MPRPIAYKVGKQKVPGTTTPINCWGGGSKVNNLCDWAQRLATEYEYDEDGNLIHFPKYWVTERDDRGIVGTVTHALWCKFLDSKQPDPDFSQCEEWQKKEAYENLELLKDWTQKNPMDIIAIEQEMVSREHRYGGTPDVITTGDIVDLKTGYVNEWACMLQCSAYNQLAKENKIVNYNLGGLIVQTYNGEIRTYRFHAKTLDMYFKSFLNLLQTYRDENQFTYRRRQLRQARGKVY